MDLQCCSMTDMALCMGTVQEERCKSEGLNCRYLVDCIHLITDDHGVPNAILRFMGRVRELAIDVA